MKFRKKPVVIDAIQFKGEENKFHVCEFLKGSTFDAFFVNGNMIVITTLEGNMIVRPGDWVIKGVNSEFYPCKNDVFEKTYEPVSENRWDDMGAEIGEL